MTRAKISLSTLPTASTAWRVLPAVRHSLVIYFMNPKGTKFYYVRATEGGYNLMERDLKKGDTKVLIKGVSGGIETDAKGENIFLITGSGLKKDRPRQGVNGKHRVRGSLRPQAFFEREYIFDHMVRQVNDKFYDKNIHGIDWTGYGEHGQVSSSLYQQQRGLLHSRHERNPRRTQRIAHRLGTPCRRRFSQTAELGAFFDP